jgi:hypothetical protein
MNQQEAEQMMRLALGRLFRIGSRPYQQGDDEQFEMCRRAVMEAAPIAMPGRFPEYEVSYARDYNTGARGDA